MRRDKTAHQTNEKRNQKSHTYSNVHRTLPFFSVFFPPEFFRSLLLSFSLALDEHNPDIPEWREDVGRVVRTALSQVQRERIALKSFLRPPAAFAFITILYLYEVWMRQTQWSMCVISYWYLVFVLYSGWFDETLIVNVWWFLLYCTKFRGNRPNGIPACGLVSSLQVSGVPEEQLLVSLYPGLPSTAELFILPDEHTSREHKSGSEDALEAVRTIMYKNKFIMYDYIHE